MDKEILEIRKLTTGIISGHSEDIDKIREILFRILKILEILNYSK